MPGSGLPSMSEKSCTIRTRKFLTNRLLARRQFVSGCLLTDIMYCITTAFGKCMGTSSMSWSFNAQSVCSSSVQQQQHRCCAFQCPARRLNRLMGLAAPASMSRDVCKHASNTVSGATAAEQCGVAALLCTSSLTARQLDVMNSRLFACKGVERQQAAPAHALSGGGTSARDRWRQPEDTQSFVGHQHPQQLG